MKPFDIGRRLGGDPLHAAHGQPRRLAGACGRPCAARTPARPARSAWAARPAAWSTRPATCPRSARSRCRRWSPTCRSGITPEFFEHVLASPQLQTLSPRELEWCGRLVAAALRRAGRHALPRRSTGTTPSTASPSSCKRRSPTQTFFYASGRSSNEAGFLLQLFARLYGTNYVNNCSYYCHQASGVGLAQRLGTGTATVTLEDVENADLLLPDRRQPGVEPSAADADADDRSAAAAGTSSSSTRSRKSGWSTSACRPTSAACCSASKIASLYVQPHIGGDIALLTGVAKALLERDAVDDRRSSTQAHRGLRRHSRRRSRRRPGTRSSAAAGVDRDDDRRRSPTCTRRRRTSSSAGRWASRTTSTASQNVQAIVNLALLRGMVGRPHAGLLPIRGH